MSENKEFPIKNIVQDPNQPRKTFDDDKILDQENSDIAPTLRQQKGYKYEMEIQNALERRKIPHVGNPKAMKEWLRQQGQHIHPPDISTPLLGIKAELKVTDGKVFPSWFKRDWIPRAEHSNVFVCSNKWKVCEWGRKWLKEHHIKLFDTWEFLEFIEKKWKQLVNRNKVLEPIAIKKYIYIINQECKDIVKKLLDRFLDSFCCKPLKIIKNSLSKLLPKIGLSTSMYAKYCIPNHVHSSFRDSSKNMGDYETGLTMCDGGMPILNESPNGSLIGETSEASSNSNAPQAEEMKENQQRTEKPKREIIEIGEIEADKLTVAPTNNRTIMPPPEEFLKMVDSIKAAGVIEPILINEKNQIVSGQMRWLAAMKADLDKIPFVRVKFRDAFDERVASITQDCIRNSLTDEEKGQFVKNSMDEGLSVEDIAKATGLGLSTLWEWLRALKVPLPVQKEPALLAQYQKIGAKKRDKVRRIFKKRPDLERRAVEVIRAATVLPEKDFANAEKEVKRGLDVDFTMRTEQYEKKEETEIITLRIKKKLYERLVGIAKRNRKDLQVMLIEALEEFVEKHT